MQIYGVMGERISDDAGKAVFSEDEAFSRDDTRGTHVVRNQEQKFLKSVRKAENSAGFIQNVCYTILIRLPLFIQG